MPFTIEPHLDESIIIGTAGEDFDIGKEIEQYLKDLSTVLDQMSGPSIYIADARKLNMNFGDITGSMGMLTRGELAVLRHPNLSAVVVVTESSLIGMGVKALGQAQYGSLKAMVAATVEEALTLARNELAPQI